MAQKRMFSKEIVRSDAFLDMPISSQLLYFHLGMEADDDGFVDNARTVSRISGTAEDDLKILLAKRFVLPLESGLIVIKHWKINNYIQNDRYKETKYIEAKKTLKIKDNGAYTECIQNGEEVDTQIRLGKVSIGKDRLDKNIGDKSPTPYEQSLSFFERKEVYTEMLELFSKDRERDYIESEFQKFSLYWTEPNKSGTKQRWQQQATFEIKRRLLTWLGKSKQFSQTLKAKKEPIWI